MPPPLQTNTGSRAALITWTVITSILFVVSTVLAIFANVDRNRVSVELDTLQKKYESIVGPTDLDGDVVSSLKSAKTNNPTLYPGDMKLLNVALSQRDALAKLVNGTPSETDATTAANAALKRVGGDASLKAQGNSLVSIVNSLATSVKNRDGQIAQLNDSNKGLESQLKGVTSSFTQQLDAAKGDLSKANDATKSAQDEVATYRTDKDKQMTDAQGEADKQAKLAQDTVNQLTAAQTEQTAKSKKLEDQIKALQNKLHDIRQPVNQIVRQADAHVMRVAGDSILYIDLGTGDQVVAGMTFEVYDRVQGVPGLGDPNNNENLPKGKASIEIIRVAPGSSECRIIRQTPGETIVEGDLCVNLVYDKNIKYNVMVYGKFDLDRNGQATDADADVIKRLVTQWGGKVTDKLNADTDFLVIGKVPEVPNYTQEELDRPEIQFELEKKKKELADFDETLARAIELNIPVLNQNRFLYFTGYYEMSAR
jgi:hypothetical protein